MHIGRVCSVCPHYAQVMEFNTHFIVSKKLLRFKLKIDTTKKQHQPLYCKREKSGSKDRSPQNSPSKITVGFESKLDYTIICKKSREGEPEKNNRGKNDCSQQMWELFLQLFVLIHSQSTETHVREIKPCRMESGIPPFNYKVRLGYNQNAMYLHTVFRITEPNLLLEIIHVYPTQFKK